MRLLFTDRFSNRRSSNDRFSNKRAPVRSLRSERGSVSPMFAVLLVVAVAMTALVVDGGRKLGAAAEARAIADNAARVGAQFVDVDEWRNTGEARIDMGEATGAIDSYMGIQGVSDYVIQPGPDAESIVVVVTLTPDTFMFDLGEVTGEGTATAIDSVDGT